MKRNKISHMLFKACLFLTALAVTTSSLMLTRAKYTSVTLDSAIIYVVEASGLGKYNPVSGAENSDDSGLNRSYFVKVTLKKGWWYFCLRGGNGSQSRNGSTVWAGGGVGGYVEGMYYFNKATDVWVCPGAGGRQADNAGGITGGRGYASYGGGRGYGGGGNGGGATIAYFDPNGSGTFTPSSYGTGTGTGSWYAYMSANRDNFLAVAGGGGGGGDRNHNNNQVGGPAGNLYNANRTSSNNTANGTRGVGDSGNNKGGYGGTGTAGGAAGDGNTSDPSNTTREGYPGKFLRGGDAAQDYSPGGGGSGWYGGGGGSWPSSGRDGGGGGGSSYVKVGVKEAPTTGSYAYIGTLRTTNQVNSHDGWALFAYLGDFNDGTPSAADAYFPPAAQRY